MTNKRVLFSIGVLMFIFNIVPGCNLVRHISSAYPARSSPPGDLVASSALYLMPMEALTIGCIIILIRYRKNTRHPSAGEAPSYFSHFAAAWLIIFNFPIGIL